VGFAGREEQEVVVQDDPWAAAGVREGDVLAGKYRVERVLGVGGMGVVVAARHVQLEERVAIKFLLPHMLGEAVAVQRFLREAKAAVRIKNEYVVRVFDVGTLETGAPYMVMEFLDGGDLSAWLQTRGALAVEQAVDFVLQTCVALADAHGMGIVHRDLKPSNLFCVRRSDGQLIVKVLDFGISKVMDPAQSDSGMSMTKTSAVMGSPLYMSPEQMRSSRDVDSRTDIWALGIILYELLSGKPPFDGSTLTEVAVKVATEPPAPLRNLRPDVPAALEAALAGCLQKDPRARYANVGQVAAALAPFASARGRESAERISGVLAGADAPPNMDSPLRSPSSGSSPYVAAETVPPIGRTAGDKLPRSNPVGGIAVAITAIVVLGGGGWAALRYTERAPSRPSPPPVAATISAAATAPPVVSIAPLAEAPHEAPALPREPDPAPTSVSRGPARVDGRPKPNPSRSTAHDASATPPSATTPPVSNQPPTSGPSCSPPYFIDAAGHRQYKPECL
jgi:serine/threonine-protein kinase